MTIAKRENEQKLAQSVSQFMHSQDLASQLLGMKVEEVRPGFARLSMTVKKEMLNGLEILHGGFTFTLADSAFAHACNSRNQKTVALSCNITYSASAKEGDILTATAEERVLNGRTGVYDVVVTNQDNKEIALFRGNSYRTRDFVLKEDK